MLALRFTERADLPKRLTNEKNELIVEENNGLFSDSRNELSVKDKKDSIAERNFNAQIKNWKNIIELIISYDDTDQAWRYISIAPAVENGINKVSLCKDFIDFTELFIKIRENDNILPEYIGRISRLHTAFQHEIERKLGIRI